ncbi:hypothetical protein RF11_01839 [Thelohanellus kitauei]|uniref:Uncharacterized protein n=1 Tax=Thelohanellus kitauei TaxID=669202 RepID=A0A0C2J1Y6_THEKT|nr:hypothetical protein RF11_01839 [Thelohanellus kitauei]
MSEEFHHYKAVPGQCSKKCKKMIPVLILVNIGILAIGLSSLPAIQLILNLSEDISFDVALGFRSATTRISLIIGPIIYGSLFDASCVLKQPILKKAFVSNCIEYNLNKMG